MTMKIIDTERLERMKNIALFADDKEFAFNSGRNSMIDEILALCRDLPGEDRLAEIITGVFNLQPLRIRIGFNHVTNDPKNPITGSEIIGASAMGVFRTRLAGAISMFLRLGGDIK